MIYQGCSSSRGSFLSMTPLLEKEEEQSLAHLSIENDCYCVSKFVEILILLAKGFPVMATVIVAKSTDTLECLTPMTIIVRGFAWSKL